jgi:hypothetical protein
MKQGLGEGRGHLGHKENPFVSLFMMSALQRPMSSCRKAAVSPSGNSTIRTVRPCTNLKDFVSKVQDRIVLTHGAEDDPAIIYLNYFLPATQLKGPRLFLNIAAA